MSAMTLSRLAQQQSGWHFGALHGNAEQLEEFRIEDMARDIQLCEPLLWDLVGFVISGESVSFDLTNKTQPHPLEVEVNENGYWAALGDDAIPPPDPEWPEERPQDRRVRLARQRRRSLRVIVSDTAMGDMIEHSHICLLIHSTLSLLSPLPCRLSISSATLWEP